MSGGDSLWKCPHPAKSKIKSNKNAEEIALDLGRREQTKEYCDRIDTAIGNQFENSTRGSDGAGVVSASRT